MASQRTIWCSACGTPLEKPVGSEVGTPVRCGRCGTVFAVPPPPFQSTGQPRTTGARVRIKHETPTSPLPYEPTPAQQLDRADMPADLLAALGPIEPTPTGERTRPDGIPVVPPNPEAARRAFDLDEDGNPRPRTGAHLVDLVPADEPTDPE